MNNNLRVSVIDDCYENLRIFETFLKKEGFECSYYDNPRDAINDLEDGKTFDVLITDFNLADELNGVDAMNLFKEKTPEITSILMSGDDSFEWQSNGFDAFMAKPLNFRDMGKIISSTHESRRVLH